MSDVLTPVAAPAVAPLPVPFRTFAAKILKTKDEVFTTLLRIRHGSEKHTPAEWAAVLDALRHEAA